jgi:hypothetical protein
MSFAVGFGFGFDFGAWIGWASGFFDWAGLRVGIPLQKMLRKHARMYGFVRLACVPRAFLLIFSSGRPTLSHRPDAVEQPAGGCFV